MKRVFVIAHFCDYGNERTNNRFNYIADLLAQNGYSVSLITSSFSHRKKEQRRKTIDNEDAYQFVLLHEPGYRKNISIKRLLFSHRVFAHNVKRFLNSQSRPDLVYCAVPSLSCADVVARYCKKNNIKLVIDIQDLWPEAFEMVFNPAGIGNIVYAGLRRQADRIYCAADSIVAVSQTYLNRGIISNKKAERHCVYLGTDLVSFDKYRNSISIQKEDDSIWVTYVGTIGSSYNLKMIVDAIDLLDQSVKSKITFIVLGDGPNKSKVEQYTEFKNIRAKFYGLVSYPEMVAYLCKSDIAVNPIKKGAAQSIINKHADYAAAGLPIVNTQETKEYRDLIEKYQCGINCSTDSSNDVAEAIIRLVTDEDLRHYMGYKSRIMAEELFDRSITYQTIKEVVNAVTNCQ